MENNDNLKLESIRISTDKDNDKNYVIGYHPLLQSGDEIILTRDQQGKNIIATADSKNNKLSVSKAALEERPYAYVRKKNGEKYGTAVCILTCPPVIRKILLQIPGKVMIIPTELNDYTSDAGFEVKIIEGTEKGTNIYLEKGVFQFDLAQAGISYDEKIKVDMQICFHLIDENETHIFGPPSVMEVVINPPDVEQVIRDETKIEFTLSDKPQLDLSEKSGMKLYASIYKDGCNIFDMLPCAPEEERKFTISTDTMNMPEGFYALSVMCMSSQMASFPSAQVPLITRRPVIQSIQVDGSGLAIRLKERGYYYWKGQYGWTDRIQIDSSSEPEIRYADRCNQTVSIGPAAYIAETPQGDSFTRNKDGYYYRKDRKNECELTEEYTSYGNESFALEEEDTNNLGENEKKWKLFAKEGDRDSVAADFKEMICQQCKSYAQIEELAGCFGEMSLQAKDMLAVRYGYEPWRGSCDIRAGMTLSFDFAEYQNIPESNRKAASDEELSDRNLSGFVGNGSSVYTSILRNGRITFEPLAQEAVQSGNLTVEQPQIDVDGRIGMGAGIWDALYTQFQAPFIKLLYPPLWKQSKHANHGSMHYHDNVCLAAAHDYKTLDDAVENYRDGKKPSEEVAYVCFRGRTTVRIMIHIFVEGHPQTCALGSTLGDITVTYGLGENIYIERLYHGEYVPFTVTDTAIPLYIGDRICSR